MNSTKPLYAIIFALGSTFGAASAYFYFADAGATPNMPTLETTALLLDSKTSVANSSPARPESFIESFETRADTAFAYESRRRSAWEIERLFENMTAEEAPAVLAKIMENTRYNAPYGLLGPFFGKWGKLDGATALAASQNLDGRHEKDALKYLFPAWAQTDARAAWDAAQEYLDNSARGVMDWYGAVVTAVAEKEPALLMRRIAEQTDRRKSQNLQSVLTTTAVKNGTVEQLLTEAAKLDDQTKRSEWESMIYNQWASENTDEALAAIGKIPDPENASQAMSNFLQGWARTDHQAALAYVFENPDDPSVEVAFDYVLQTAMRASSADTNKALIAKLEQQGLLSQNAARIASSLSWEQPETALILAANIVDEKTRQRIQSRAIQTWVSSDFDSALAYYEKNESAEAKLSLLPGFASRLYSSTEGGSALVSLFEPLPPSPERSRELERLLTRTASMPARPTSDFLEGLKALTAAEPNLSEAGQEARRKLFGENP